MTKVLLAAFFALISTTAVGQTLEVQLAPNESNPSGIDIRFATKATHSSMCFMRVKSLALAAPTADLPGSIDVAASSDFDSPCMTAFGPHTGLLSLQRGNQLPSLGQGEYTLNINGESYGLLEVTAEGAELNSTDDADHVDEGEEPLPEGMVAVTGVIHTGIAAIGGETTGVVLITADGQFELQLADDAMTYAAEELNGSIVKIIGKLVQVEGVEISLRTIIKVNQLDPA